ncbi:DNA-binding protein [Sphingomonas molluscorum]|uniref:DNA-binding protein n=1 Tax=Sphingomonas molluscorum TaxID=418184 RepID=UPI0031D1D2CA
MSEVADDFNEDRLVDTHEASIVLGQKPGTLRKKRVYGGGCHYHKIGRSVRYSIRDLNRFKAMNRVASTSEHWAAN